MINASMIRFHASKCLFVVVVAASAYCLAIPAASGALVNTGDLINVTDGPGNGPGGSFKIENATQNPGVTDLFRTFCVETNEFLNTNGGQNYYATIEDRAIFGGVGVADIGGAGSAGVLNQFDPLSPLTAWLYSNAIAGTLSNYSASSNSDNDALQTAIWYSEDEGSLPATGLAKDYYDAAVAAMPTSIGAVRVMNLWTNANSAYTQDGKVQSLLVIVPEASTIAIWSILSLCGLAIYRRRVRK